MDKKRSSSRANVRHVVIPLSRRLSDRSLIISLG